MVDFVSLLPAPRRAVWDPMVRVNGLGVTEDQFALEVQNLVLVQQSQKTQEVRQCCRSYLRSRFQAHLVPLRTHRLHLAPMRASRCGRRA